MNGNFFFKKKYYLVTIKKQYIILLKKSHSFLTSNILNIIKQQFHGKNCSLDSESFRFQIANLPQRKITVGTKIFFVQSNISRKMIFFSILVRQRKYSTDFYKKKMNSTDAIFIKIKNGPTKLLDHSISKKNRRTQKKKIRVRNYSEK